MKRALILIIGIALLFMGCATWGHITYEDSICVNRPVEFADSKSWICVASERANLAPEEVDNFLLDATAVAWVFGASDQAAILNFLDNIEDLLGEDCSNVSYTALLNQIFDDAAKVTIIMRVISRRLPMYYSDDPISPFDCWLIYEAIKHQREQFAGL
jgi:hypothetical protein